MIAEIVEWVGTVVMGGFLVLLLLALTVPVRYPHRHSPEKREIRIAELDKKWSIT